MGVRLIEQSRTERKQLFHAGQLEEGDRGKWGALNGVFKSHLS